MAIKSKTLATLILGALLGALPGMAIAARAEFSGAQVIALAEQDFALPDSVADGTRVKIDGDESMAVVSESLKQAYQSKFAGAEVELSTSGTDAALSNLLSGGVDVAAIGRSLTEAEKAQGLTSVVLAREKIAIVVSEDNPFSGDIGFVKFAQLFRGEITDWSELGDSAGPIRFLDRPESSDTRQSLNTYPVFQEQAFATGSTAEALAEDNTAALISSLGSDGVGYAIYSQVKDLSGVKVIPMHKVLPNDPAYPYSQPRVYVYKGEPNEAVQSFLGLATAPEGETALGAAADAEAAAVAAGQNPTGDAAVQQVAAAIAPDADATPQSEASDAAAAPAEGEAETSDPAAADTEEGQVDAAAAESGDVAATDSDVAGTDGDVADADGDAAAPAADATVDSAVDSAAADVAVDAPTDNSGAVAGDPPAQLEQGEALPEGSDSVDDSRNGKKKGGSPLRSLLPLAALAGGGGLLWWLAAAGDDEDENEPIVEGSSLSGDGNLQTGSVGGGAVVAGTGASGAVQTGIATTGPAIDGVAGDEVASAAASGSGLKMPGLGGLAAGVAGLAGAAAAGAANKAAGAGEKLGDVAKGAVDAGKDAGSTVSDGLGRATGAVGDAASGVTNRAGDALSGTADKAADLAAGAKDKAAGATSGLAGSVGSAAGNLKDKATGATSGLVDSAGSVADSAKAKAAGATSGLTDALGSAAGGIKDKVTDTAGGVTDKVGDVASGAKDMATGGAGAAASATTGAVDKGLGAGAAIAGAGMATAAAAGAVVFGKEGNDAASADTMPPPDASQTETSIESVLTENRLFYPSEEFSRQAQVKSQDDYHKLYVQAKADPEGFWADLAETELHWFKKWDKTLEWNSPDAKWFSGGKINITYNCLDRHLETDRRNKPAIVWEGEPGDARVLTYAQLHREVCLFANSLKKLGIKKGDVVGIYMPMVPEAAIAMLACARIGAPHSVVFGGFSAEALRDRLNDGKAKLVITADGGWRKDKAVELKPQVDKALENGAAPTVENVLVVQRTRQPITMESGRDHWWHDIRQTVSPQCEAEPMDSEDVLFILYTSGSTGKPKGVVHTTGGYNLYTHMTTKWIFDLREDDVYWCTADVGWITGHSYIVYGPLSNGATSLMYEGAPRPSNPGCFWDVVEKYKVSIFYTAPTAVRAFIKMGEELPNARDLSSLRLLGTVGEPINPEAWMWYHRVIGGERCPIVDTWWQTETGGVMITSLPGAVPTKPGSAARPFPGIIADVVDKDGNPVPDNQGGYLIVRHPWPSMIRGVYGDPERFRKTYFEQIPGQDVCFAGDGARIDQDGYFWVMGRVDDVISVSGHRLGTMEIESALVSHPAVAEAAVVGRPDDLKGEEVFAFVTLEGGQNETDALVQSIKSHVVQEIGALARPSEIKFTDALPKTRSGKIMRRLLRKVAAGEEISGDTSTLEDRSVLDKLRSGE